MTSAPRLLSEIAILILTCAGTASAAEPGSAEIYRRYCASCHGATAKGDGPVAPELRTPPTDLTTIERRNGGRFDLSAVMSAIDGRRQIAAHGSRQMPVWGAIFSAELQDKQYTEYTALLQSKALAEYLETLQVP